MAQTSSAAASDAVSANEASGADKSSTPPLHVVERVGGRSGRQDRAILQILRFVAEGGDADVVADRAVASLGLLPDVLWAELDGDCSDAPGRVTVSLDGGRHLTVQLADPSDQLARAAIEGLLAVIGATHRREREVARLRSQAHTDALTGLFNRRGFEPFIEQALARACRSGEEIAVMMCDVDHFKRINDARGHEAGDQALVAVAKAMTAVIRPSDLAARYGGDELVILLSGANARGATIVAARLRAALREAGAPSLSMGIADTSALGNNRTGPKARAALLAAADEALYSAKSAGRDRWSCHASSFCPVEAIEDHITEQITLKSA